MPYMQGESVMSIYIGKVVWENSHYSLWHRGTIVKETRATFTVTANDRERRVMKDNSLVLTPPGDLAATEAAWKKARAPFEKKIRELEDQIRQLRLQAREAGMEAVKGETI